jgi:hypothetical protein
MVARKVLTIHWLCEEQTKPQTVLLDFKMAFYMAAKIAISYATAKDVLESARADLA